MITVTGRPAIGEGKSFTFRLKVEDNSLPDFNDPLRNQVMFYNETKDYFLPRYTDMETAVHITANLQGKAYLPGFIRFNTKFRTFYFTPDEGDIGTYTIDVTLIESTGY